MPLTVSKIMTWEKADDAFDRIMESYLKAVRAALTRRVFTDPEAAACLKMFERFYAKRKRQGHDEIEKALWKQTRIKRYGRMVTRGSNVHRTRRKRTSRKIRL